MPIKSDAEDWTIKEQNIEDRITGLTFQFEKLPTGRMALRVFGKAIPFGNREFLFWTDGTEAGNGTVVSGLCRPAWLTAVDEAVG